MYFVLCEREPTGTHTINHWPSVDNNPLFDHISTMNERTFEEKFGESVIDDGGEWSGWGKHWYWYTPEGECLGIAFRYNTVRVRATCPSPSQIKLFLTFIFTTYYGDNHEKLA